MFNEQVAFILYFDTPLLFVKYHQPINFLLKFEKVGKSRGLVKISAICSFVSIACIQIVLS